MPISYAGYPLLLDDPDGVVQRWLDDWHALDDVRPLGDSMVRRGNLSGHTKGQRNGRGLPKPNYPAPPPIRLNSLYWPTGAARWATFFAFVDKTTGEAIQAAYKSAAAVAGSAAAEMPKLVIDDGTTTLEIEMHVLTPRIVTVTTDDAAGRQLWILPLVDDRWFWQFQGAGSSHPTVNTIATELNRTITVDVAPAAAYVEPDWLELNRTEENAGILLDALAHGFGQRFVRRLDGENHVLDWATSAGTLIDDNLVSYKQIAGGIASHILPDTADPAPVPETVRVVFRFWRDGIVLDHDFDHRDSVFATVSPYYTVDVSATDVFGSVPPQGVVEGVAKTFHSTMYAIIGYSSTERSSPTNGTELSDLADQIAADYYASLDYQYDLTFAGIKEWKLTGYDDHLEIRCGSRSKAGEYLFTTRVQSCRPDFGSEVNLSQTSTDVYVFGDQIIVYLSALTRYDGATYLGYDDSAVVYEPTPATADDSKPIATTGLTITVFSVWGNDNQGNVSGWAVAERVHDIWLVTQVDEWATPQEPAP